MSSRALSLIGRSAYSINSTFLRPMVVCPTALELKAVLVSPNYINAALTTGRSALTDLTAMPCNVCPPPIMFSYRDDLRREQFNRIVGKIGIRKRDAGIYWNQYKTKRIKIRKRKRVI